MIWFCEVCGREASDPIHLGFCSSGCRLIHGKRRARIGFLSLVSVIVFCFLLWVLVFG